MNHTTLEQLRHEIYDCFEQGADALFNLADALLCESQAQSLPELSLSPFFERKWPSVYEALEDGQINVERLRSVLVKTLLAQRADNEPIWIAVDASNIERPAAPTSADRGMIHLSNLPLVDKPISVGWQFSNVVLLPEQPSSWTAMLDQRRISTQETPIQVAIAQLRDLRPLFGRRRVIVVADRGYCSAAFLRACHELGYSVLSPPQKRSQALPSWGAPPQTGTLPQRWSSVSRQTPRNSWASRASLLRAGRQG